MVTVVDASVELVMTDPAPRTTMLLNVDPETVALVRALSATLESLTTPPLNVDVAIVELVVVAEIRVELLIVDVATEESVVVAETKVELLTVDVAIYESAIVEYVTSDA